MDEAKAKIKAHKGHITREIKALTNATVFCARNPSADARGEVEELLKRVKRQAQIIREYYEELCDIDQANIEAYSKKLSELQDQYATVSQEALEAMNDGSLAAPARATAQPIVQGVQLKVQSALKLDKLTRDNTPAELTSWARRFRAFYSMSQCIVYKFRDSVSLSTVLHTLHIVSFCTK